MAFIAASSTNVPITQSGNTKIILLALISVGMFSCECDREHRVTVMHCFKAKAPQAHPTKSHTLGIGFRQGGTISDHVVYLLASSKIRATVGPVESKPWCEPHARGTTQYKLWQNVAVILLALMAPLFNRWSCRCNQAHKQC